MKNKKSPKIVTVLGAGNMGTAVAQVLALNKHRVHLWNWEEDLEPLHQIEKFGENKKYLPGIKLSHRIVSTPDIDNALRGSSMVFFVVPAEVMSHTISFVSRRIENNAIVVDISKGVQPHNLQPITTVITKRLPPKLKKNVVSLSGPAIARQMAERHFTAMNVASKNLLAIKKVKEILENRFIKLIPTTDIIGVEISGSFKNVYAVGMGICDGLGFTLNTKAALLTRSLEEMSNLVYAMGGKRKTVYGLAGFGDLIGTALSNESRNRQFGECIGKGMSMSSACKKIKQTVEGIHACECLVELGRRHKVDLPFATLIYNVVKGKGIAKNKFDKFLSEF